MLNLNELYEKRRKVKKLINEIMLTEEYNEKSWDTVCSLTEYETILDLQIEETEAELKKIK